MGTGEGAPTLAPTEAEQTPPAEPLEPDRGERDIQEWKSLPEVAWAHAFPALNAEIHPLSCPEI
eukprot:3408290-Prorocentrum_lima.AAC.1